MKINGYTIPTEALEREWQRLQQARQQNPSLQQMSEEQMRAMTRDNVIAQHLLAQEAARQDLDVDEAKVEAEYQRVVEHHGSEDELLSKAKLEKEDVPRIKEDLRGRLKYNRFLDSIVGDIAEPTEKEVFDEYMRDPVAFGTPEQVHASHIVKHTNQGQDPVEAREAIDQVKQKLDDGADFEELAETHSDCASGGQDLGFFARGQMVEEFEDVVFNMEPDQVSDVFKTDFGFHIARVHEKKKAQTVPFEEIKDQLKQAMFQRRQTEAIEAEVARLKEKAEIELDEE